MGHRRQLVSGRKNPASSASCSCYFSLHHWQPFQPLSAALGLSAVQEWRVEDIL